MRETHRQEDLLYHSLFFFEIESHIVQNDLEIPMHLRLALNFCFFHLSLPHSGIVGLHHHNFLKCTDLRESGIERDCFCPSCSIWIALDNSNLDLHLTLPLATVVCLRSPKPRLRMSMSSATLIRQETCRVISHEGLPSEQIDVNIVEVRSLPREWVW